MNRWYLPAAVALLAASIVLAEQQQTAVTPKEPMKLFNGKGTASKRSLFLTASTEDSGIEVNLVLKGTLARTGGRYSYQFDLDIPDVVAVTGAPPVAING